jgi:hypothetical protein
LDTTSRYLQVDHLLALLLVVAHRLTTLPRL